MSLTLPAGPLSARPPKTRNYEVDGPAHKLLMHPFPRRVRAEFGGHTVADTRRGMLLHETGLLPQLYIPEADLASGLLEPSGHTTHCPFKGDARYHSVRAGDRFAENAVWSYPEPMPDASWLAGYAAVYWDSMDAWWDEDEQVRGHLRDPYHRVDARATSRRVRVYDGDRLLADSDRPVLLSETGLPNRFYLPRDDVRQDALRPSSTETVCPYKGTAAYFGRGDRDVAWVYEHPLEDAVKVAGHVCFDPAQVSVEVDGEVLEQ
ncbi:uncharacterized protein (DUF427 family) [Prauserella shujinwangii]|uniref:Uncharacterized protein (DUF427 family) n=1 Tax=Prauserella shujinwangii TaxID=1453103 RepID=A0A2T0M0R6_9PSEU|nr:DUF427 domain-containing protein [Prauserella shujinwangii]PRX50193.1 uncharacterized protein (DUF427 family) [Prauserella shujinwangii]